jgi:hypothetical protein
MTERDANGPAFSIIVDHRRGKGRSAQGRLPDVTRCAPRAARNFSPHRRTARARMLWRSCAPALSASFFNAYLLIETHASTQTTTTLQRLYHQ